jgi:hypothetical protein
MKALDIEIGTAVRKRNEYATKGTIIGNKMLDGDEVVAVEWLDGSLTKYNINDLRIVSSELERDYEEIKEKILAAAVMLNEANLLASKHDTDISSLAYDNIDFGIGKLHISLRNAGWSTSSLDC